MDDMTQDEQDAYQWELNQQYQSVAARYARSLAMYIRRTHAAELPLQPTPPADDNVNTYLLTGDELERAEAKARRG